MNVVPQFDEHYTQSHRERRGAESAIPMNLREFLNDHQRSTLKQIESFGWHLAFVRRPLFQDVVVVIANEDDSAFSVLEKDGSINSQPDLFLRH